MGWPLGFPGARTEGMGLPVLRSCWGLPGGVREAVRTRSCRKPLLSTPTHRGLSSLCVVGVHPYTLLQAGDSGPLTPGEAELQQSIPRPQVLPVPKIPLASPRRSTQWLPGQALGTQPGPPSPRETAGSRHLPHHLPQLPPSPPPPRQPPGPDGSSRPGSRPPSPGPRGLRKPSGARPQ